MIDFFKEKNLLMKFKNILGIDESGRGPWAGPIVIAGVLLESTDFLDGVDDSKKLIEKKRDLLYSQIIHTHKYRVVVYDNNEIDKLGVGNAQVKAMREIMSFFTPQITLIDGYFKKGSFDGNHECIIDGDAKHYSIAAASIVAKCVRDKIMKELDLIYPLYNFKSHKGYGTKEHQARLKEFGICPIHRISYKPIQAFALQ